MTNEERLAWNQKMMGIYSKFDVDMQVSVQEGMRPDPVIVENKGGYIINFSLHPTLTEQVASFAEQAKKIAPTLITYAQKVIHTTLSDFKVSSGFIPQESEDHEETVQRLVAIANEVSQMRLGAECLYESGFVFNRTTGIVKGVPRKAFLTYAEKVVEVAKKHGMELRLPWGAHITFARSVESISAQEASELKRLCESVQVIDKWPKCMSVNAGWFSSGVAKGFDLQYAASFPLADD